MYIQTQRCLVRPFEEKDIDNFMLYRNNLDWMIHQGFKGLSKIKYQAFLLTKPDLAKAAQFAVSNRKTNELIGDIYLKQEDSTFWLGYTITPAQARKGYASEVVSAVLASLSTHGCRQIKAGVLPENQASIRLLEKLGFTYSETDDYGEKVYIKAIDIAEYKE